MGLLINNCDEKLFHSVAQEVLRLAGTNCVYYQLEQSNSVRDPLYDEIIEPAYTLNSDGVAGIPMYLYMKAPDETPITGEEGFRVNKISDAEFAIQDFVDNNLNKPRNGDIVKVWDEYYDVIIERKDSSKVNDATTGAIMYVVDLVRRTEGPPEGLYLRDIE